MAGGERMTDGSNEITIAWGDVSVTVSGDQSLDELEARVFSIIDRLDERLNKKTHHDVSFS